MSTCNRLLKAAAYIVYVHSHQSLLHHMFKEVVSQKQRIRLETFSGFYRSCSYCEVYKSSQNFSKSSHMINLGNQPKSEKMEMKLKRHLCKKKICGTVLFDLPISPFSCSKFSSTNVKDAPWASQ